MAQKKYTFMRVYDTTNIELNKRVKKVNDDLKIMGIKRSIPKIKFIEAVTNKLVYMSDREIIKLSCKRKCRLC